MSQGFTLLSVAPSSLLGLALLLGRRGLRKAFKKMRARSGVGASLLLQVKVNQGEVRLGHEGIEFQAAPQRGFRIVRPADANRGPGGSVRTGVCSSQACSTHSPACWYGSGEVKIGQC